LVSFQNTRGRGIEVYDLASAALFFVFSLFSVLWPETGRLRLGDSSVARGYLLAPVFLALGFLALSLGRFDFSRAPAFLRFVRRFYPQALFGPLFSESILLSGAVSGGASYDALFAGLDQAVFGFQPARAFSAALGAFPVCNEIMFGAYFSFYLMLVLTPWIPYFRGDEEESGREVSILSLYMLFVYIFYALFRVQGPKYWLPDLRAAGYVHFRGGIFTSFLTWCFGFADLSGAAFPSSHVAVSLMMTFFVAKTDKRLAPLYSVLSVLVALATVYIYAHWVADVVGGAIAALALVPLLDRLCRRAGLLCHTLDERFGAPREQLGEGLPKNGA